MLDDCIEIRGDVLNGKYQTRTVEQIASFNIEDRQRNIEKTSTYLNEFDDNTKNWDWDSDQYIARIKPLIAKYVEHVLSKKVDGVRIYNTDINTTLVALFIHLQHK